MSDALTKEEFELLEWLSREDFSQYGECHGPALDALGAKGLVKIYRPGEHQVFIAKGTSDMHRAVALTEQGSEVLRSERRERQLVFAFMPAADGGPPIVLVGLPLKAWEDIKSAHGRSQTVDLSKVGIPFRFSIFGTETQEQAKKILEEAAAAAGLPLLDESGRDFSIDVPRGKAPERRQ